MKEITRLEEDLTGFKNLSGLNEANFSFKIAKQFSNFFNSYAKAFNKENHRNGSLFTRPFKRKEIAGEDHLKNTVIYIHQNPVTSRLVKKISDWHVSSYNEILRGKSGFCRYREVISWFDDLDKFKFCSENNLRV